MDSGNGLTDADFANWLDTRMGKNGLTSLHIAVYKGDPASVRKLVSSGARTTITSKYAMNVIHFAAQGNKPWPIAYFREEHSMSLDEKDDDGNTPLHWACNFGSAIAAEFLLKWTDALNERNNLGLTPLHLAVNCAIASDNVRLAKILLFAGADRQVQDNKGQRPIDLVRKAETERKYNIAILAELRRLLTETSPVRSCLSFRVPAKKHEPNSLLAGSFIAFNTICHMIMFTVTIPSMRIVSTV